MEAVPTPTEIAPPATMASAVKRMNAFGLIHTEKVMFDDGVSYVEVTKMNEGARRKYLLAIARPMKVSRDGQAEITMNQAGEREALLKATIIGWDLELDGNPFEFNEHALRLFLANADVDVIDRIDKAARQLNSWLLDDVTIEDLDKQIDELTEMRDKKIEEEAGKVG